MVFTFYSMNALLATQQNDKKRTVSGNFGVLGLAALPVVSGMANSWVRSRFTRREGKRDAPAVEGEAGPLANRTRPVHRGRYWRRMRGHQEA